MFTFLKSLKRHQISLVLCQRTHFHFIDQIKLNFSSFRYDVLGGIIHWESLCIALAGTNVGIFGGETQT